MSGRSPGRALARCTRGAAAIEFALVAPFLFGFIFLVLEGGRMVWTQQALQETAFAAARCMGVGATGCTSESVMPAWTVTRARASGLVIAASTVTAAAAATAASCDNRAGMSRITILSPYAKAVGRILPAARTTLTATACFPKLV